MSTVLLLPTSATDLTAENLAGRPRGADIAKAHAVRKTVRTGPARTGGPARGLLHGDPGDGE